jgi:hypothetical protein
VVLLCAIEGLIALKSMPMVTIADIFLFLISAVSRSPSSLAH